MLIRLFTFLILFSAICADSGSAQDYKSYAIEQQKREAERKKRELMQKIQHMQSDPESYTQSKRGGETKTVTLKKSNNGHFFADAKLNDNPIRFMVDTGATAIFISQQDAKKSGINTTTLHYNKTYQTATGQHARAAETNVKSLDLQGIKLSNVPVVVSMEKSHMALLGMSFFNRIEKFDVDGDTMTIYD